LERTDEGCKRKRTAVEIKKCLEEHMLPGISLVNELAVKRTAGIRFEIYIFRNRQIFRNMEIMFVSREESYEFADNLSSDSSGYVE
jgi:hypothetical protein